MPEAFDPVPPAPDSMSEIAEAQKKRKRKVMAVVFGVLPLAIGGGGYALVSYREAQADREVLDAYQRAAGCLLATPLEQQKPSVRYRRIQLEAVRVEKEAEGPVWPNRCADPVAHLNTVMRQHSRTTGPAGELSQQAEQLALSLRKIGQLADASSAVDGFFEAASRAGYDTKQVIAPAQPPPAPGEAFDLDGMPKTALVSPMQYTADTMTTPLPPGPELHVMLYDRRLDPKPIVCTFTAAGPDASCRKIAGEVAGKAAVAIGGSTDPGATPLLFVGHHGSDGIYRIDGSKVAATASRSAYVAKDGYVALTTNYDSETGAFELWQQSGPGAEVSRAKIEPEQMKPEATQIHRAAILWNKLVIQTYDAEERGNPRLQFMELPANKPKKAFSDIGEANWLNAPVDACRSGDSLVLQLGQSSGYLSFFQDGRWSKPLVVQHFGGDEMACDGPEAVFDSFESQQRCTAAGCKDVDGAKTKLDPFQTDKQVSGDLNGKQLLVATTQDGGLRFRHGSGDHQLLLDDRIKDGQVQSQSGVTGMQLFARSRFAVLLLSTSAGVFAVYFDPNGKPWPAKVAWAG